MPRKVRILQTEEIDPVAAQIRVLKQTSLILGTAMPREDLAE
jgi:hypothetical protein